MGQTGAWSLAFFTRLSVWGSAGDLE
jgi:hypothetical protein